MSIDLNSLSKGTFILKNSDISYVEDLLLDENGGLKIVSYDNLKDIPQNDLTLFCLKYAIYGIPTVELIDFLQNEIGKDIDDTIEIGAGNGILAKALGITATDSYEQDYKPIKVYYDALGQPTVKYGANVKMYDAISAIKLYKPRIVIASWVTHLYNPKEHFREGNELGVDEGKLLKMVKKYIFIGNHNVHSKKPILSIPHKEIKPVWLCSRSLYKDQNIIYIWER